MILLTPLALSVLVGPPSLTGAHAKPAPVIEAAAPAAHEITMGHARPGWGVLPAPKAKAPRPRRARRDLALEITRPGWIQ